MVRRYILSFLMLAAVGGALLTGTVQAGDPPAVDTGQHIEIGRAHV